MMRKQCLECEDEIYGRIDKKFCSDQCRNTYNNRQNSNSNNFVRNINAILRKNRRILEEFAAKELKKFNKQKLLDKGFNFSYHTDTYVTKDERTYYYCYDFGYLMLTDDLLTIVKKKEYIN